MIRGLLLSSFSLFSLFVYLPTGFADVETSTFIPCPSTAAEAKKAFTETETPNFSDKCYDSILQHLSNGEEDWINNADAFQNSGAAGFTESIPVALTEAIVKNPVAMLGFIDRSGPDVYKGWCTCPFNEATPDEIIPFNDAAIAALKKAKISPELEELRRNCIDTFVQDKKQSFFCKFKTPQDAVASLKKDSGQQLLNSDQCAVMLSYQFTHLKSEWLTVLPELTNKAVNAELRDYIRDSIVLALPRSPETVIKLISQYYGQQQLAQVCHPDLSPPAPDPEADIDTNIKIDPDPYYNLDNYQLNVSKAIAALSTVKLIDPRLSGARDMCLKGLQQSLHELQQKEHGKQH